ncbi:hypothetical protein PR202_gb24471 [Eleusine coracana subsp. coracana]|uniref:Uncharacterized protein n=1 Tax=Eleusine coracana subsp. coracana TaxID=191504 RepID=A0AAV5FLP4_ELECO|nr:hypothetical protein PR202_gb24471 [Eleusine coracana subsp. coracana]
MGDGGAELRDSTKRERKSLGGRNFGSRHSGGGEELRESLWALAGRALKLDYVKASAARGRQGAARGRQYTEETIPLNFESGRSESSNSCG